MERSLAQLSGDKVQATKIRKGLEKKIQQAAVKKLSRDQKKPGYGQEETPSYNGLEPAVPFTELPPSPSKGIFELRHKNSPSDAVPMFDEEIGAVVGYRLEHEGVFETFDINGDRVDIQELPLEKPLLDPIDLITVGGFVAVSVRKALQAGGIAFSANVAGRKAIELLSQSTLQSLRAVFRRAATGTLKFTVATTANMRNPHRYVPVHIFKLAIKYGRKIPDPQGAPGASKYITTMFRDGKRYTLNIVVRNRDRTVLHYHYKKFK